MSTPCDNLDCYDCHPDDRPDDDDTIPWYFNLTLVALLTVLALVVVAAGPKP